MKTSWEARGACLDRDPKLWDGEYEYLNKKAKEICFKCPVIGACLTSALINDEPNGIWGGHTKAERDDYRPTFLQHHKKNLNLLKEEYKHKTVMLEPKYEHRLEKARMCKRKLSHSNPKYNQMMEVLDQIIQRPEASAQTIGKRLGISVSTVQLMLREAMELVS
ncbi:MAG: hypothetical protein A4E20_11085 [Nitrospira sp. SG-bin2]|uniref:WhiB family transcriptional regulator n=1 Tax=Nitrospira cf. moscoviensis SBR1015 TaxID=96242 RepID=UPI000A0CAC7C|nr:WhiB family transcriptional regulator [Nitrospira cf. moscoviensis SBR1015]OQW34556.1 MAG: hypothetical protein A4E20_11085 [Nitrospira sp. SG-bin2]